MFGGTACCARPGTGALFVRAVRDSDRDARRFFIYGALGERIQFRVGILFLAKRLFEERGDPVMAK